ncbi:hypothetical protein BGW39_010788 [Mortierella sp. 14UC]|nr:hypothetical protein BGW39_010788 [Mortierella sp. 14UC]
MAANTPLEMVMAHDGEPWPIAITDYLLRVDPVALEQEYYGPFNTILTHVFPFAEHYAVAPQSRPIYREAVDYLIRFMLMVNKKVVVGGVEIRRESDIDDDKRRKDAHKQVVDRFRTMHDSIVVPVIVIVSAIGRRCRVYRYTHRTGTSGTGFWSELRQVPVEHRSGDSSR